VTAALSADQRSSLEKLVQTARRLIEEDLEVRLAGSFGINADGRIEDVRDLSLSNAQASVRHDLVEIVEFLRSEGEDDEGSVARLVREAAFTHTNRLIAVRVAEAIGLLPETIGKGVASSGFRDFSELAPSVATTEWGRFAEFLRLCADELAADVPALFDPRNPLLELTMSEPVLAKVVEAIAGLSAELWAAPDALGWAYQFFNTGEERAKIKKSGAPKDSVELAIVNQFFTPSYVVDFLVHNGLGAYLAAGFPGLAGELSMLAEVPTEEVEVDLQAITVLDPACGSGHFLLGAYDVLERAWHHAGIEPAEAAPSIVRSLWGIDIDPRATQIAQAAVMFRARRHCRHARLPMANVICARSMPVGPEVDGLIAALPDHVGRAVKGIADELLDAPRLGPLLKIEERLDREVRDVFGTGVVEGTLSEGADAESDGIEASVLNALSAIADSTTSTSAQRLFAAEAQDAFRFVEAMTRRYTAVLMNPPFGDPVASSKPYLKAAYEWIPSTSDLFALFVGRGLELTASDGSLGAITSRVGLFLTSFEEWRSQVLFGNDLGPVVDLGERVMEQATVEAAAYVLRPRRVGQPSMGGPVVVRALTMDDRPTGLQQAVASIRDGGADAHIFRPDVGALARLDGCPLAYWIDPQDVDALLSHPVFEPGRGSVRQGLATGDDFQFVRTWWEVSPSQSTVAPADAEGKSAEEQLRRGAKWAPIVKSGSSQPWFSPNLLVVDWERDGYRLKNFFDVGGKLRSRPQNTDLYFRPGFSWTRRAPRLVPYVVPEGCISSVSRYQAFPNGDPYPAVGVVASNVASAFCRFYGEKFLWPNFLVDNLKTLPIPDLPPALNDSLAQFVDREVRSRQMLYSTLEPFREFVAPSRELPDLSWNPFSLLGDELEREVARAYGLDGEAAERVTADTREALSALGNIEPTEDDASEEELGVLADWIDRLVSYLMGVALGRWDVRIGSDPTRAPASAGAFTPPSPLPPGMLRDGAGGPAVEVPPSYPVDVPAARLLVDQAGHDWDVSDRVRRAAVAFLGDDGELDRAVAEAMKKPSLVSYIRGQFFKSHLATYSKGRRKAPIYWQLQVPSKAWGIWLYGPKLSREMLFAVVRETEQRQRLAEHQIGHLQREAESGGGGRKASEVAKELEAEQKLAVELASFRAEAERIANLGWEPDLDDGMVLNAAPLADLFPAWKVAAAYRKELRVGKYEWATVARYADQL